MKVRSLVNEVWTIQAICSERGECDLLAFLGSDVVGEKTFAGVLALFDRIAKHGPQGLSTELSHRIAGKINQFTKGSVRILWFYDDGKIVVCSHGFLKRGQKTPTSEIDRAQSAFAEYQKAKTAGKITIAGSDSPVGAGNG